MNSVDYVTTVVSSIDTLLHKKGELAGHSRLYMYLESNSAMHNLSPCIIFNDYFRTLGSLLLFNRKCLPLLLGLQITLL